MTGRTKLALGALGAGLGLGMLGDGLFRTWPWGVNVGLWILVGVLTVVGIAIRARAPLVGGGRWLLFPLFTFAAAVAWRDSPVLLALNLLAVVVCLALCALYGRTGRIRVGGLMQHFLGGWYAGIMAAAGTLFLLFADIEWQHLRTPHGWRLTLAVLRGVLLTVPLLLVFGGLLVAADAAFAGLVAQFFHWDLRDLVLHITVTGVIAWIVAGVFRHLLLGDEWHDPLAAKPPFIRLGGVEVAMVLGALDLLFVAFVLVQFRYFFGGADLVETSASLTYAEYARRGFFELVYVAMFALPLLLFVHWTIPSPRQQRGFRVLAGIMIALLVVIMASALERMRLYTAAYGLTELRLYPTAFMAWLALVFAWFAGTVLRGRRPHFAFGALANAFVVLLVLNVLNPDAIIARVNLGRDNMARPVDGRYLGDLSADAIPVLVENIGTFPPEARPRLASAILRRWTPPTDPDWRGANWSRSRAWEMVTTHRQALENVVLGIPADRD